MLCGNLATTKLFSFVMEFSSTNKKMISCICLGPKRSGKTHLLKALEDNDSIDENTYSTPTNGTSLYNIVFPINLNENKATEHKLSTASGSDSIQEENKNTKKKKTLPPLRSIRILEIGGSMAPIWRQYFNDVKKLMYVIDTANLCQISAAGVLFYSILSEPRNQKVSILLVLSKMDYAYRQMRNEALLMLQMSKLKKEIRQRVTIIEVSPVSKIGLDEIYNWLKRP